MSSLPQNVADELLAATEVGDVWGVGRQYQLRLNEIGIRTAMDLRCADLGQIRDRFGIVLTRTAMELRGQSCIDLQLAPPPKKQIVVSRSFGSEVDRLPELISAVSSFIATGAEKLRRHQLTAGHLQIFAYSNPFSNKGKRYSGAISVKLPTATADTLELTRFATHAVRRLWRPDVRYKKAGIMLNELANETVVQHGIFAPPRDIRRASLMDTIDTINDRFGRSTLHTASTGFKATAGWSMRQENRSPRYTTNINELPIVR